MVVDRCAWILALLTAIAPATSTVAADWPMWHRDAQRSGYSPEPLPATPNLQWVLELPIPSPAWGDDQGRLRFDHHYEPILFGGRLYVPSMVRDRLTCYDAPSGNEVWRFYADGPIRLAAAGWEGRVYFACDDGYLYCLGAESGELQWRYRGGPADRCLLGNGRMISSWPARGAPVVRDGKVYFAASIWPLMGVFIHALDARTGKRIWTNSGTGEKFTVQQHSSPAFAGVAPQGYLVATPEHLVVPGGRTIPAVLRRGDGALLNFNVSSRRMGSKGTGGYDVFAGKDFFIVEGGFYRLVDGRFVAAVDAAVLGDGELVGKDDKGPSTFETGARTVESTNRWGRKTTQRVIPKRSSSTLDAKIEEIFSMAGDRLFCRGSGTTLLGVDLPHSDGEAVIGWSVELPDEPRSVIAGDGRVFASTDAGRIYCFAEGESSMALPPPRTLALIPRGAKWTYRDDGKAPDAQWKIFAFDDSAWASGAAPLGYGSERVVTELSYGDDAKRKPITCYFRHDFEVDGGVDLDTIELRALVDDGAAFHLNGREVGRLFLARGDLTPDTVAEKGTDSRSYYRLALRAADLVPGSNTLAVEVHQREPTSSDLLLDLELVAMPSHAPRWSSADDAWEARAREILELSGARAGYCLAIGLGTGRLAIEIARQSQLQVVVVDPNREKLDAFRRHLDETGVYGTRVAAVALPFSKLELPAYFAELVVAEEPEAAGIGRGAAFVRDVFHCLRPASGTALFQVPEDVYAAFARATDAAKLDRGSASYRSGFAELRRTAPPTGSADWTHQYADSANSVVSRDTVVKAPFKVLWFGGPSNADVLPRHGHGPAPQVVDGRLFIQGRDMLRATDIYTGRLLWQRELPDVGKYYDNTSHEPGANAIGSNYVSLPDGIYVLHDGRCLRLDPATGETVSAFELPSTGENAAMRDWGFLAARGDVLIAGGWPNDFDTLEFTDQSLSQLSAFRLRFALGSVRQLKDFEAVPYDEALALYPPPTDDGFQDEDDDTDSDSGSSSSSSGGGLFRSVISDEEWQAHTEREHRAYLLANLNKLLFEEDMVAKIPPRQRGNRRGGRGGGGARRGQSPSAEARGGAGDSEGSDAPKAAADKPGADKPTADKTTADKTTAEKSAADKPAAEKTTDSPANGAAAGAGGQSSGGGNRTATARGGSRGRRWPTLAEISADLVEYLKQPGSQPNDRRALELKREVLRRRYRLPGYSAPTPGKFGSVLRTGNRVLYALDRGSGEVRWAHPAAYEFRHSTIALGRDAVFGIDRMSAVEASYHRRRGNDVDERASVVALDLRTGGVRWRSTERVFGTWLGYSDEYDVLIQAGAYGPDRSRDEARRGIVAYRGATGEILWSTRQDYSGPCLLLGRHLITQGYRTPGFALDLMTGAPIRKAHPISGAPLDWGYTRKYGCNTAIGSPNLLTFRSAHAGYYDLLSDCGTSNLGGIRAGCTSNLIPAGGILNAPDYTRTCTCSYQNQVSAAFIHDPTGSRWSFSAHAHDGEGVEKLGINFGAPGDRRGPDGTLWLDVPSVGGESPDVPIELLAKNGEFALPSQHESWILGGQLRWVAASGLEGEGEIVVHLEAPDQTLEIQNEATGRAPLRVSRAVLSEWIPPPLHQTVSSSERGASGPVSVAGGFRGSGSFSARVEGYPELATESVTAELWVQSAGDPIHVEVGDTRRARQGFVLRGRKPKVEYFVAVPETAAKDEGSGSDAGRRRGRRARGGSARRDRLSVTLQSRDELPAGRWSHVAFTYDAASGVGKLFVDGRVVARDRAEEPHPLKWEKSAPTVVVGGGLTEPTRFAEVRICGRALEPDEFLLAAPRHEPENVLGHWQLYRARREPPAARRYTVRLVLSELEDIAPGKRSFDVWLQGNRVLASFDPAAAARGGRRSLVREFVGVPVRDSLHVRLVGVRGRPLLSGIQLVAE